MPFDGQIVRLFQYPDDDGAWSVAAEVHTPKGSVVGRLRVRADGGRSQVSFAPDPDMKAALADQADEQRQSPAQPDPDQPPPAPEAEVTGTEGGGAMTTASVPTRKGD